MITKEKDGQLVAAEDRPSAEPSTIQLLQSVIDRGITAESVGVLKELMQMRREEMAFQNKQAFNQAFFALKKEIATMEFYSDREALTKSGETAYIYCSEAEIASKLEPVLFKHGFAMLFGQRQENERVVAEVTLIHEQGHEEKREYAVRTGVTNAMKDATAVDTGSTTSAWRHLVIKLFGLKSRISDKADARNEGDLISADEVRYLDEQLTETAFPRAAFFRMAGVAKLEEIRAGSYPVLARAIEEKRMKKV